jgi:recombination protein RecT
MERQATNQAVTVKPTPAQQQAQALAVLDAEFKAKEKDLTAVLPENCSFERFHRIVKTSVIQTPELLIADRVSLFMSCFKCAQDGLLPDGREAALVIFNTKVKDSWVKKVQYMPMVAGILKKIRNSGELESIAAHVVYASDEFDYSLGDDEHIIHKPNINRALDEKYIAAYAICKTKDGAIYREIMGYHEIQAVRNCSKAKDSMAWKDFESEMARKTVIRRLAKRLPMSSDLAQVITRDDELYNFKQQEAIKVNNLAQELQAKLNAINTTVAAPAIITTPELEPVAIIDGGDDEVPEDLVAKANAYYNEKEGA